MIDWIILAVSFLSLYLGIFWIHIVVFKEKNDPVLSSYPTISFIIPAYNEEKGLRRTVRSLIGLHYPREKMEIILVDHGSIDATKTIAQSLIAEYKDSRILLLHKERTPHAMKAHAFNEGLRSATGEFIACVDADTFVMQDCLHSMMPLFDEPSVGAVISTIKVQQPKNIYEKIQHLEYIFASFTRSLMSKINTLHVTPGALSLYRRIVFDRYGGFDEQNLTEDLEMAMRLRAHGYSIKQAQKSITYTRVPRDFKSLWHQRVRWFRGFIFNSMKYRHMLFKKKYDLIGTFQYPLNFISLFTILLMLLLLSYTFFRSLFAQIAKLQAIGVEYFLIDFSNLPTLKELLLNMNIILLFPLTISFFLALFIYNLAHKNLKERWQFPFALMGYLTVYPFLRSAHWVTAFYKELFRTKNKWK